MHPQDLHFADWGSKMNFKKALFTLFFLLLVLALLICVRRKNDEKFMDHLPANALRGGGIAYAILGDLLDKSITDNDFTKFANNPDNYEVVIKEDQDSFTYTFFLKTYRGRPVLDGVITFKVNKKNWKVVRPSRP